MKMYGFGGTSRFYELSNFYARPWTYVNIMKTHCSTENMQRKIMFNHNPGAFGHNVRGLDIINWNHIECDFMKNSIIYQIYTLGS